MTLLEFIPFIVACLLACFIAWSMFLKSGWTGLIIGSVLGIVIIIIGLGLGVWIAARWWPKSKNKPKKGASG